MFLLRWFFADGRNPASGEVYGDRESIRQMVYVIEKDMQPKRKCPPEEIEYKDYKSRIEVYSAGLLVNPFSLYYPLRHENQNPKIEIPVYLDGASP